MNIRCQACGKDVEPTAGPGAVMRCPDCRAVMPPPGGATPAAGRPERVPPLKARGAEFRNKHSVEAGAAFSKSMQVFVANLVPFLAVTVVVLSPEILYGVLHALQPVEDVTAKSAERYAQFQMIIGSLLRTLVSAAIISGVFQHLRGSSVSLGSIFAGGMSRVLPALWTGILASVASILPMAPGFLIMFLAVTGPGTSVGLAATGGVVTLIGAIFAIVVSTMVYVAVPTSVVEKCNGFPAIKRSLALTKGNRGQIFVILLALGILGGLANLAIQWMGGFRTVTLLSLLVAIVMSAFGGVFAGVVYYNLRAVKEGIGIEELAKAFD